MELLSTKAYKKSEQDVIKLKEQINVLLKGLQNTGSISKVQKPKNIGPIVSKKFQANGIQHKHDADDAIIIDDEDVDEYEDNQPEIEVDKSMIFKSIPSETCLTYLLDNWVYSIVVKNETNVVQKLPSVLLSLAQNSKNHKNIQCFTYFRKIVLCPTEISEGIEDSKYENLSKGIAVQDQQNDDEAIFNSDKEEHKLKVYPGQKIFISVRFQHPLGLNQNEIELVFSLFDADENVNYWSQSILISKELCLESCKDFEKHQDKLFLALSDNDCTETFKLEKIHKRRILNPLLVGEFLEKLHINKLKTENINAESQLVTYGGINSISPLFGLLFRISENSRKINSLKCSVNVRSRSQLEIFFTQFQKWFLKEKDKGKDSLVISTLFPTKDLNSLYSALQNELSVLMHLIHLRYKGLIGESINMNSYNDGPSTSTSTRIRNIEKSNKTDLNWLRNYFESLSRTDELFLPYFK